MSPSRLSIAARGVSAAFVSTFVALLLHVVGGGEVPALIGIIAPLVLSALVCVALAGRTLSLVRLGVSVWGSQFLFHSLFVLGTPASTTDSSSSPAFAMRRHMHTMTKLPEISSPPIEHVGHAGVGMWVAHFVAGLVTVVALYSAERVLISLAALTRLVLSRLLPDIPVLSIADAPSPNVGSQADQTGVKLSFGVYPVATAHRGPPVGLPLI